MRSASGFATDSMTGCAVADFGAAGFGPPPPYVKSAIVMVASAAYALINGCVSLNFMGVAIQ
jgi:hypothetical protein